MSMSSFSKEESRRRRRRNRRLGESEMDSHRRLGIESFDIRDLDPCKPIVLIFGRNSQSSKTYEETIVEMLQNNQSNVPSCDTLDENSLEWKKKDCTLIEFNYTSVTCGFVNFVFKYFCCLWFFFVFLFHNLKKKHII